MQRRYALLAPALRIGERYPGQPADLDPFVGQLLGFFVGRLAVDAARVALAVMDLARFLGEAVADILVAFLDHFAKRAQQGDRLGRIGQAVRLAPDRRRSSEER